MGQFSKLSQIMAKIYSNSENFAQILPLKWTNWYMIGSLFPETLVFVCVYFQISRRHILTETKLEYPDATTVSFLMSACLKICTLDHITVITETNILVACSVPSSLVIHAIYMQIVERDDQI